jgi:hypothetical protein
MLYQLISFPKNYSIPVYISAKKPSILPELKDSLPLKSANFRAKKNRRSNPKVKPAAEIRRTDYSVNLYKGFGD